MADKKTVEGWCSEINVAAIMADWSHISKGHIKDSKGKPPAGKSYFTEPVATSCMRIYDTVSSSQKRVLYEAGDSSRALVVRDFSATVIGTDDYNGADCNYCVVCIGLASSGAKKNKPIVYTAYPATSSYVGRLTVLG